MTPLAQAGSVYLLSHVSVSLCEGCVLTCCLTPFIGYMCFFFFFLLFVGCLKKTSPKSMWHSVCSQKTTNTHATTSGAKIDFHDNTFLLSQPQELQWCRSGHGKSAPVATTTGNGLTFSLRFTSNTSLCGSPPLCVCVCKAGVSVCKCCFVCVYVCVIRDRNWIRDGSVAAVR